MEILRTNSHSRREKSHGREAGVRGKGQAEAMVVASEVLNNIGDPRVNLGKKTHGFGRNGPE